MTLVILAPNEGFFAPLGMTRIECWGLGVERWAFPLYLEVDVDPTLVDPVRRGSFASR